jgi:hypothetical protein
MKNKHITNLQAQKLIRFGEIYGNTFPFIPSNQNYPDYVGFEEILEFDLKNWEAPYIYYRIDNWKPSVYIVSTVFERKLANLLLNISIKVSFFKLNSGQYSLNISPSILQIDEHKYELINGNLTNQVNYIISLYK